MSADSVILKPNAVRVMELLKFLNDTDNSISWGSRSLEFWSTYTKGQWIPERIRPLAEAETEHLRLTQQRINIINGINRLIV